MSGSRALSTTASWMCPHIEIEGFDTLEEFIAKLDIDEASPTGERYR
jgi:hypothetical protein